MESIVNSFFLVFVSEMGDKTQLLALVLAAKFKKPTPILLGILVATILNHGLASFLGAFIQQLVSPNLLRWILSICFIGFGLWILKPDKEEGLDEVSKWGPFLTSFISFFLAEMGDKTQLATVALAAKYTNPILVTLGTTLGMMGADGLAVFFGANLTKRVPMKYIHRFASVSFICFGIIIFIGF